MRAPVLALRLSRRALAAAVLDGEGLSFFDGRHLRSGRDAAAAGVARYARLLVEQARAASAVIECPAHEGRGTAPLLDALERVLGECSVPCSRVAIADLLHAYGLPGLRSRRELREVAGPLFAELASVTASVRPYVVDAAAAALHAEAAVLREAPG